MSFDLAKTSTLQAVATPDEQALVEDLQRRVEEAVRQSREQPEVLETLEAQRGADLALSRLQTGARVLNAQAKELREHIASASAKTLDKLIESAAAEGKLDYATAANLAGLEHRDRLVGRAVERVVERLTPLAQMAQLRAEAHAFMAQAKAMEGMAQQRAEKLLGQLREAVSEEVVLPIDMSKGVAGALLTQAAELKRRALEASVNADRIEKAYMERHGRDRV